MSSGKAALVSNLAYLFEISCKETASPSLGMTSFIPRPIFPSLSPFIKSPSYWSDRIARKQRALPPEESNRSLGHRLLVCKPRKGVSISKNAK